MICLATCNTVINQFHRTKLLAAIDLTKSVIENLGTMGLLEINSYILRDLINTPRAELKDYYILVVFLDTECQVCMDFLTRFDYARKDARREGKPFIFAIIDTLEHIDNEDAESFLITTEKKNGEVYKVRKIKDVNEVAREEI